LDWLVIGKPEAERVIQPVILVHPTAAYFCNVAVNYIGETVAGGCLVTTKALWIKIESYCIKQAWTPGIAALMQLAIRYGCKR